jgi:hypothetical protein
MKDATWWHISSWKRRKCAGQGRFAINGNLIKIQPDYHVVKSVKARYEQKIDIEQEWRKIRKEIKNYQSAIKLLMSIIDPQSSRFDTRLPLIVICGIVTSDQLTLPSKAQLLSASEENIPNMNWLL